MYMCVYKGILITYMYMCMCINLGCVRFEEHELELPAVRVFQLLYSHHGSSPDTTSLSLHRRYVYTHKYVYTCMHIYVCVAATVQISFRIVCMLSALYVLFTKFSFA